MPNHSIDWGNLSESLTYANPNAVARMVKKARFGGHSLQGSRTNRAAAAVELVRRYAGTTSQIMRLFGFNGTHARMLTNYADTGHEVSTVCGCGKHPKRVAGMCTWCWDAQKRQKQEGRNDRSKK